MPDLNEYREKRNFEVTGEPSGKKERASKEKKPLIFVVQHHEARRDHYDFRLEWEGALLSWAVPKGPSYDPADKRLAIEVEPHPIEYAGFEGTIPKGQYGGGTVMIWDEGTWLPQAKYDFSKGLQKGTVKIVLEGKRLKGKWALVRLKPKEGEEDDQNNWLLLKEKDEYALEEDGIAHYDTSVKSGRTMHEIAIEAEGGKKKNPFETASVQLAKLETKLPLSGNWLYEVKYDGYRMLAFTDREKTRLLSRNGGDYTHKFQSVAAAVESWAKGRAMVLDGEMVAADENGKTDFQALQNYIKRQKEGDIVYMIFDLLAFDGEDYRQRPIEERKAKLSELLTGAPSVLRFSKHVEGRGKECYDLAKRSGFEGIIGKKAGSRYAGDRNGDWIKLKCYNRQEFVVGGFTRSDKKTEGISALLLGYYDGESLLYAGRAGTGMSEKQNRELTERYVAMLTKESPFAVPPKGSSSERLYWVRPETVAEVQFAEFTNEKRLRQASFKGLRFDKSAKDVHLELAQSKQEAKAGESEKGAKALPETANTTKESPEEKTASATKAPQEKASERAVAFSKRGKKEKTELVLGVEISSPERMVYADKNVTKVDVARYYEAVSERMMRYAGGRVLSVVRCLNGIESACFFKKHPTKAGKGVGIVPVQNAEGESDDYFYVEEKSGFVSEAQLGTLEFHIWGSKVNSLEHPDMMVFDLDPDEKMELSRIRQGAKDLKEVFDTLNLQSFLKTSGGKGYHVVVPFREVSGWDAFHAFAERIARLLQAKWPERYTSNIRKENRKGKIFVDYMRNGRGATSIAPYSLRARAGASVSCPISWEELDSIAPDGIDLEEALRRIRLPDPWESMENVAQKLNG